MNIRDSPLPVVLVYRYCTSENELAIIINKAEYKNITKRSNLTVDLHVVEASSRIGTNAGSSSPHSPNYQIIIIIIIIDRHSATLEA
jgi:hypothetical protein